MRELRAGESKYVCCIVGALMSNTSAIGSSGLPSFDSTASQELTNSNFNSLVLESGLGSSLCYSPGGSSTPGGSWRLPEKLQIVKPIEGSSTLQVWSALATPNLGNLLDKRPGVHTRVERQIDGIGTLVNGALSVVYKFKICFDAISTFFSLISHYPLNRIR